MVNFELSGTRIFHYSALGSSAPVPVNFDERNSVSAQYFSSYRRTFIMRALMLCFGVYFFLEVGLGIFRRILPILCCEHLQFYLRQNMLSRVTFLLLGLSDHFFVSSLPKWSQLQKTTG